MTALVADIGGTNTRVALAEGAKVLADSVRRYRNADHDGLNGVLAAFMAQAGHPALTGACVALAGPVRDGVGRMTNLDWTVTETDIAGVTGAGRVALLNDLQAQGHALDHLPGGALAPVLPGPQAPGAARLVIGLGTGVNVSAVHRCGSALIATAAEAGHVTLPAMRAEELALAQHAAGADGFASVEDVLSGRGVEALFAWVTMRAGTPRRMTASQIVAAAPDDAGAEAALELYTRLLGRVAGDLALHHLPFGGIYLIGGVARAVTPHLPRLGLADSFRDKGRFAGLMEEFAIHTLTDDYAALTGCAACLNHPD
ncbi:glucokinase [Rhodovulum adriaticum]|uniref:Glucokinase n=1 Tax=Rhodovulum adriaticum TaxID=35804 RepID=A0A4R2NMQ8_RHOAD|nr:glucokinase [Rhodovulum adriaticum]MBK1636922.1 glucokinase [Rhodovulum adriaticum]TCP22802.1 glucokinase [Rhodovulum adriaticum]